MHASSQRCTILLRSIFVVALLISPASTSLEASDGSPGLALSTGADQMNLLVIMTDEHNFRTLGCYRETMEGRQAYMWGDSVVKTPNIDWFAKNGALCTSFYATTPVCSPSRAALISGMYPHATPVHSNNVPLDDQVVTFAKVLGDKGYKTGFAGKWHLDGTGKPQWEPKRKFGFEDNRFMFNRGHWKNFELTKDGPRVGARKGGAPTYAVGDADEKSFATDWLVDRTMDFIADNKSDPWCYMLSLPDPHGPDKVRAPYDTMFADQEYIKPTTFDKPEEAFPVWGQKQPSRNLSQAQYYGMIKCIDDNMGQLIEKLRSEKILDKTIIVFTSDHGDLRGEHHRQNKGVPYEGSTRVPFLLHYPGKVKPGIRIDQAMTSVDFMPTILAMMGFESPPSVQGRDASKLFTGEVPSDWNDVAFVRGTGDKSGWLMAVTDRYKLVLSSSDQPWFFDLERDPDEVANQFTAPAYRETILSLGKELNSYCEQFKDPFAQSPRITHDLDWAAKKKGPYQAFAPPEGANEKKRSKKNDKKSNKQQLAPKPRNA